MATNNVHTIQEYQEPMEDFHRELHDEIERALGDNSPFWTGVQWFLDRTREQLETFIHTELARQPMINRWAGRLALSVTDLIFTVIGTLITYLRVVIKSPNVWTSAHASAMRAWQLNEDRGLLAQGYAYSKKMAAYFMELLKQCFERAVRARGLELPDEERQEIAELLARIFMNDNANRAPPNVNEN